MTSVVKISFFLGAIFLSLGIYLPFFPLWLEKKAFSTEEIAFLLSVPLAVKVIFTPFITAFAGRLPQRRQAAISYCGIAFTFFLLIGFVDSFWLVVLFLGVFGAFWHTLIPLGDSFALSEVRINGANYGTIRLWGSLTFILANLGAGYVLGTIGAGGAHLLISAMLLVALFSAFLLPVYGLPVDERPKSNLSISGDLGRFLKNRPFIVMSLSAALLQSSHALIYGFGTIDWIARGYSTGQIGAFWAVGVIAEIILFTQARWLFGKIKPYFLLLIGGSAAILRWSLHAEIDGFIVIVAVQCLHGFSFGATHLAMQSFIAANVNETDTPTAQGVMVLVGGIVMTALTLGCGKLYFHFGNDAFYGMALVCVIGLVTLIGLRYPQRA